MTLKRILKNSGKIILYIVGFLLIIVIVVVIFINTHAGKVFIKNKAQSYLQQKLKTKVTIASVDFSLPKWIEIKGIYLEDQNKDTLLFGEKAFVDIDMLKLVSGKIDIGKIEFKNIFINIYTPEKDSIFNYQFVMQAFSSPQKSDKKKDTSAMEISLRKVLLNDIRLKFNDRFGGNNFSTGIKSFEANLNRFQPDRMDFGFNDITASGINFFMVTDKESTKTDTATGSSVALLFDANKINFNEVNISYKNKVNGMLYSNKITALGLNKLKLDLAKEHVFLDKINLDNSTIQFTSPKASIKKNIDTLTVSSNWQVSINQLQLNNNIVNFNDNNNIPKPGFDFSHIGLKAINIQTGKIFYSADSILANINQLAFNEKSGFILDTTHAIVKYSNKGIEATELYIKTPQSLIQNTLVIKYDDIKKLTTSPENSEVNINLNNTKLAVNDLYLIMPMVKKYLPEQKFKNNLIKLSTEINGTLQRLNIPVLQLSAFGGSVVNAKAILYNITDTNNIAYDISVLNSTFLKQDIAKLLANNKELLNKLPPVITLSTHLKGNLKNTVADINIKSKSFSLLGNGQIYNFNNPSSLKYNVAIKNSRVEKSFLEALVPAGTIPANINLPGEMVLTGTAKGDMNNVHPNLTLSGSYGVVKVNGYVLNFKSPEKAVYDLTFATQNFKVGKLIMQDTVIGNLSFLGYAKGKGFNYKTLTAVIKGTVESVGFKKYDYKNIVLNANLVNGDIKTSGSIDDPNIKLNYTATANVKGKYPVFETTLIVDTVQLKKLNLYRDTLNASFTAYLKAADLDPENMDFIARIDSSKINIQNKLFRLDSVTAKAKTTNGRNVVSLASPLADIVANGNFQYDKIGSAFLQYLDRYYKLTDTVIKNYSPQQLAFIGIIKKSPVVSSFVPGLDYDDIPFSGSFTSNQKDSALKLNASIPYLIFGTNRVSNSILNISSLNDQIKGLVKFDTLHFGTNLFYNTALNAKVAGDSISLFAVTKDLKNKDRFAFGADFSQHNKAYSLSIKDTLLLDYKKWNVAVGNRIAYSPKGILVQNFLLSNDSTTISVKSRDTILNSPVDVVIDNFKIKDITSMVNSDTLLASGIIDGKFSVGEFDKKVPSFTGILQIDSLKFMQQTIGTIKMHAEKSGENTISGGMDLLGNGNSVVVKGDYYLNNDVKQFDANLNIVKLNMTTLQAFSQGNLARSAGSIKGEIVLDGKFTEPHWNGYLNFDSTKFSLTKFGTAYSLNNQKVSLTYPTILFDKFTIKDSTNNEMVVDGSITSKSISEYDLNFGMSAKNFTLVNVSKAIANQVYGFAAIDANIAVTGNSTAPVIEGNISLTDKSDVTLVLPESNINKEAAKSVVRFIDRDTFALPEKILFRPLIEAKPSFAKYLNYNLNIAVSKKAALTIIIDPSSGDELKIQGDANLNAGVDPGGNIVLAGNYALNSGYYILNYQFLRKQFNLLSGSTIAFSGSPTDAQINITAEYIAKTSAKDLLANEIGSVDPRLANTFKQEIPFRVLLTLKGSMLKPEISFNIELPDENVQINSDLRTTIDNKLTQIRGDVAATNKQVFSLLLFNRFVGEQSTDFFKGSGSGDGGGFSDLARQSVSKFLSSALDNIASDLFKGLDVDLGLNSYKDYSSGDAQQKTDLNVAVTKSFINDRLSISVGKNFGIEGQDASAKASQQKGSGFLPDVTVNYKLTQDGKYLLRAYKKSQFEVILDGYVVETGLAFVVTLDYDKFRNLINKKSKNPIK